ncbi:RNA ligase family protein [Endozoicomonas acroporae]|uniref:RNA ligase family protein n=1 Tax=Endozoicomonas acroporae TaxID=1701104 RepID=UPI0019D59E86|nr:RNA ligase family protein [Endozoicomonas acroporae]
MTSTVIVEEKVDGANLGISIGEDNQLQVQNRGQYLSTPYNGQFSRLNSWLGQYQFAIKDQLDYQLILFGEWCAARHSLDYNGLPDWFLLFDVYDRKAQTFWSVERRDKLAASLGLPSVPKLYQGKTSLSELMRLLNNSKSRYRNGSPEGVIIRKDSAQWCEGRAKLD